MPQIEARSIRGAEIIGSIDVNSIVDRHVIGAETALVVKKFPTLTYMLGSTRVAPELKPDEFGPMSVVREGSALYGLTDPIDAKRWAGIANHVLGSARHTLFLAQRLAVLSAAGKARFAQYGYDTREFDDIDPVLLRDFVLLSHSGRRAADEARKYGLEDDAHSQPHIGKAIVKHLEREGADPYFIELLRVENDAVDLAQKDARGYFFPSIIDNILTLADWTFDQKPTTLNGRFLYLHARKREESPILDKLNECGRRFQDALVEIIGSSLMDEMFSLQPPEWEMEMREGYVAHTGLAVQEVFPHLYG